MFKSFNKFTEGVFRELPKKMQKNYGNATQHRISYLANNGFNDWLESMRGTNLRIKQTKSIVSTYMDCGDRSIGSIPNLLMSLYLQYDIQIPSEKGILTADYWERENNFNQKNKNKRKIVMFKSFNKFTEDVFHGLPKKMQKIYGNTTQHRISYLANNGFDDWLESIKGTDLSVNEAKSIVSTYMDYGDRSISSIPGLLTSLYHQYDLQIPAEKGILTADYWEKEHASSQESEITL